MVVHVVLFSRRRATNYSARHSIEFSEYADKAKSLAETFGSLQKKKSLISGKRKMVEDVRFDLLSELVSLSLIIVCVVGILQVCGFSYFTEGFEWCPLFKWCPLCLGSPSHVILISIIISRRIQWKS